MTEPVSQAPGGPLVIVYRTRVFTYRVARIERASAGDLARWSSQHMGEDLTIALDVDVARSTVRAWCERWQEAHA